MSFGRTACARPTSWATIRSTPLTAWDIEIRYGEYVALMGPSGSGKSTFMNLIGALDTPTAGEYYIAGQLISAMSDDDLAYIRNREIGFRLPDVQPAAAPHRPAECRAAARLRRRAAGAAHRARNARPPAGRPDRAHVPQAVRAFRRPGASAWRSPGLWWAIPRSSWPTSPPATSTPPRPRRSWGVMDVLHKQGNTIILVTHEPDIAMYARTDRPAARRKGREGRESTLGHWRPRSGRRTTAESRETTRPDSALPPGALAVLAACVVIAGCAYYVPRARRGMGLSQAPVPGGSPAVSCPASACSSRWPVRSRVCRATSRASSSSSIRISSCCSQPGRTRIPRWPSRGRWEPATRASAPARSALESPRAPMRRCTPSRK